MIAVPPSLNDLIGQSKYFRRYCQPQSVGGLEVDEQQEFRRLLDRQVGRLGAFQDLIDMMRSAPEEVVRVSAVTCQPANRDERAGVVERGQPLARRKLDNLSPRLGKERRAQDNQGVNVAAFHFGEGACDLLNHRYRHRGRFNADGPRRAYDLTRAVWMRRIVRIE